VTIPNLDQKFNSIGSNLRLSFLDQIIDQLPELGFWELIAENTFNHDEELEKIIQVSKEYSMSLHCVGMNIGGTDPLNYKYLKKIKELAEKLSVFQISDHLCFQKHKTVNHFDLLPIPFNKLSLENCINRIDEIQNYLGRKIAIENLSYYLNFKSSSLREAEFLMKVMEASNCTMILDLNNIEVNQKNKISSQNAFMDAIDFTKVSEIHLAGAEKISEIWVDTHCGLPSQESLSFIKNNNDKFTNIPICYERDSNTQSLNETLKALNEINSEIYS